MLNLIKLLCKLHQILHYQELLFKDFGSRSSDSSRSFLILLTLIRSEHDARRNYLSRDEKKCPKNSSKHACQVFQKSPRQLTPLRQTPRNASIRTPYAWPRCRRPVCQNSAARHSRAGSTGRGKICLLRELPRAHERD